MSDAEASTPAEAWASFVEGLREAGDQLSEQVTDLDPAQQALAFRALLRGLNNQLGRFEVDRERPDLVAFNGWREKMFMDNPDFRYWVGDIRGDRRYRLTGSIGDAVYQSVTAYSSSGGLDAAAGARIDSDSIDFDDSGGFEITLSGDSPAGTSPTDDSNRLVLPKDARVLWVRQFHNDVANDQLGWCTIEPIGDPAVVPRAAPLIDPERFDRHLSRLGQSMSAFPATWKASTRDDLANPNQVRHWSEMAGGAAFTEPGIHYIRGSWLLEEGEALVLEGAVPPSRYWNVLLYDRFLNSLDPRRGPVSYTGATAGSLDGSYRFVISADDPGPGNNWLDTSGLPFGIFVFRLLQAETEPALPTVTRCRIAELRGES